MHSHISALQKTTRFVCDGIKVYEIKNFSMEQLRKLCAKAFIKLQLYNIMLLRKWVINKSFKIKCGHIQLHFNSYGMHENEQNKHASVEILTDITV